MKEKLSLAFKGLAKVASALTVVAKAGLEVLALLVKD